LWETKEHYYEKEPLFYIHGEAENNWVKNPMLLELLILIVLKEYFISLEYMALQPFTVDNIEISSGIKSNL
jgi:hypothetical protein